MIYTDNQISKKVIVDLVLSKTGIRKTITKYVGLKGKCQKCHQVFLPPKISSFERKQLYGHGFKAWVIYQRVALRLSYKNIIDSAMAYFQEHISHACITSFIKNLAAYYKNTGLQIAQHLLDSPFIHADETTISIRGIDQYVWVFTNGKYVIFKLSETRESTIAQEFLAGFNGILISDFYSGYDLIPSEQQKCWVHLIRDVNNDLWSNPFDFEYEAFVVELRNLIIPIMETIQKYGLKRRNLHKFRKPVEKFYATVIDNNHYKSELTVKYQKRFLRNRDSLFTFLEKDGIPWNNNTAERAIRHLARQRDVSRSSFHEVSTSNYLIMLSIQQTCTFQGKSFFKFLFSGETDLDRFEAHKRKRRA